MSPKFQRHFYLMRIPFNPHSGSRAFWLSHLVGATFLTSTRRLQSGLEPVQASKLVIQENKFRLSVLDSIRPPVVYFFFGLVSKFGCILGEVSGLSLVTASCNSAYYPIFGRFAVS